MPAFVPEAGSRRSEEILDQAAEWVLSPLTMAETRVTLIRKAHRGVLNWTESDAALAHLDDLLGRGLFRVEPLTPADFQRAPEEARRAPWPGGLRTLDALHLAVALRLGLPLATFDADLAQAARACGHPVIV